MPFASKYQTCAKSLFALALAAGLSSPAFAAVIRVDASAVGANNGSSWPNAYKSLQSALAVAVGGDQIWIANGTYKPADAGNPQVSFVIPSGVALYGGFAGTESTLVQRDWKVNITLLSGDIDNNDLDNDNDGIPDGFAGSNSFHVVRTGAVSAQTRIDGVTIVAGDAWQGGPDNYLAANPDGAGLWNDGGTPIVENVRIIGHIARRGAGLYTTGAATLKNVYFSADRAYLDGGAILVAGTHVALTKVELYYNVSVMGGGGGLR